MKGDAGADKFNGGNGNDDITPGAGQDQVMAKAATTRSSPATGNGTPSTAAPGVDKVTADRSDVVKNCEYVKRPTRAG